MNCKKATRLMSEACERPLNVGEKLSLGLHKSMCSGCRHFDRQVNFLSRAVREHERAGDQPVEKPEDQSGD